MNMVYLSTTDIAKEWNVSSTWVSVMCGQGRIKGAIKKGRNWKIPKGTKKPYDKRAIHTVPHGFTFIDLFAGIGGFHQAMTSLGGVCVMASEINQACVDTYENNFEIRNGKVQGDINKIEPSDIPPFDVLCAGFPCQPFSKAGAQKGFDDKKRGGLFYRILDIIDKHPEIKFLILENVRNLADHEENWNIIRTELQKRNFYITEDPIILSPSDFGIPQIRERVYILGVNKEYRNKRILSNGYIHIEDLELSSRYQKCELGTAWTILEENAPDRYIIPAEQEEMIFAWEEFRVGTHMGKMRFPIWINCFGVGEDSTEKLKKALDYDKMPEWKQAFVDSNRKYYLENKEFIDRWIQKHDMLTKIKIYQKFEWNCGTDIGSIKEAIVQIRQSGIRAKRPTFYPSLVAIVNTPIVWDESKQHFRHITPREAANLQSFEAQYEFLGTDAQIYKQLGNAVNVQVVKILSESLFRLGCWRVKQDGKKAKH